MTEYPVLVVGDTLVDFLPDRPGPVDEVEGFSPNFGGAGANVAMGLERLGAPPLFWTRLARDGFGDFLAATLADSDVPGEYVVRDAEAKTTLAFVTHDDTGTTTFDFFRERAAASRLAAGTVPDEALADVEWVHVTSTVLGRQPSRSAVLDLLKRASRRGCTVSFDPNARTELWHSDAEFEVVVRGVLDCVDLVKASPEDLEPAGFDVDRSPAELARAVTEHGPHTVSLTLGDDGALWYGTAESQFEGLFRHPGYDVDSVDATGAGDAFLAGVVASATHGVTDPERVLEVANAAGAVATTRPGALTALSDAGSVRSLCGSLPWE